MSSEQVAVTGLGMASVLGPDVERACAAARAGISRAAPLAGAEVLDEPSGDMIPVAGFEAFGCQGFLGVGRLARLGEMALTDLMANANLAVEDFEDIPMLVAVPGGYYWRQSHIRELEPLADELPLPPGDVIESKLEETRTKIKKKLIPNLAQLTRLPLVSSSCRLFFGEQAGFASALAEGIQLLQGKKSKRCIVGGIASFIDNRELEMAGNLKLLKHAASPVGFMPGEAAAFVLLETDGAIDERAASIQAQMCSPTISFREESHRFSDEAMTGTDLAETIKVATKSCDDKKNWPQLMVGNLNGDYHRSTEWGHAIVRLPDPLREVDNWYPVDSFGEVGAAFGAVATCVAIRSFQRDYANTESALVWISGDDGARAAFLVNAA